MSHKEAKKQRKFLKTAEEKLKPILPMAFEELNGDEDAITEWFLAASYLANLFPEQSAEEFLPSKLENIGESWVQDFAKSVLGEL